MKHIRRIGAWVALSLLLQLLGLFLIDHFYLNRQTGAVEAIKMTEIGGFLVPESATDLHVSFDGAYLGYLLDGKLQIQSLKNHEEAPITLNTMQPGRFQWLPDRDMVIFSDSRLTNGKKDIEIKTYEVATKEERSYPWIEKLPVNSEVEGIELSPLTNVVYVRIKVNPFEQQVFKYDIMDNLTYVMTVDIKTVIKEMQYKDELIYQSNLRRLSVKNSKGATGPAVKFSSNRILLGVDGEDHIYLGLMNDAGQVEKILYNKEPDAPEEDWKVMVLPKPVLPEQIKVCLHAGVYLVEEKSVYNLKNGKETQFSGQLVEILDKTIVSVQNHQVQFFSMVNS